ncbi:MAG TPA: hypothetical protein VK760_07275, partial [Candidatus Acidoferrales bacterium]|nr:hypothetical protein [Candidatus Acidoferrales bacterium]
PVLEKLIVAGTLPPGYAVEDDAAIHLRDGKLVTAISAKPGKHVYAVRKENGAMIKEPLQATMVS